MTKHLSRQRARRSCARITMNAHCLTTLLLLSLFVPIGCSMTPDDTDGKDETIPFQTLKKKYVVESKTPKLFVIRSEAEEAAFLINHSEDSLPEVEYSERIVAGVLVGARSNNSYDVSIDSVKAGGMVVLYATETGSATGGRVVTYPAHVVTMERRHVRGRRIEFAELQRICDVAPCWRQE